MNHEPADLLPLTPAVFHILLVLSSGASHGYAIMTEVDALTAGQIHLGPGTLYRSVHKMVADGLIERVASDDEDERRAVYRITRRGRELARAEARRLDGLVREARARNLLPAATARSSRRNART